MTTSKKGEKHVLPSLKARRLSDEWLKDEIRLLEAEHRRAVQAAAQIAADIEELKSQFLKRHGWVRVDAPLGTTWTHPEVGVLAATLSIAFSLVSSGSNSNETHKTED